MQGGPHVIWGRGLACPDGIVRATHDGAMDDQEIRDLVAS